MSWTRKVNKLSQKFEIRRPHFEGKKESSCSMILPAKFMEHIGIQKGDYVRIYEEQNRIIVERMANQIDSRGQIDNK
jgi:formylmethanofuran dehydrogenase subunit D